MSKIGKDIMSIARAMRRHRNAYMAPLGLKGLHVRYLMALCDTPGISQDQLAQRLGTDKSNVARQAVVLEEQGYLLRQPSQEDKRVLCLLPTEKTMELLPHMQKSMDQWEEQLTRELTGQEYALLQSLLEKVRKKAEEAEVL